MIIMESPCVVKNLFHVFHYPSSGSGVNVHTYREFIGMRFNIVCLIVITEMVHM